jgi:hypothetical protein
MVGKNKAKVVNVDAMEAYEGVEGKAYDWREVSGQLHHPAAFTFTERV